jgi:NADPH-dependent glutamate synthase beta subunit-like oxidoreductase
VGLYDAAYVTIAASEFAQAANQPGVYVGGENVKPGQSVVEAAADGRRAALAIHQYLRSRQSLKTEGLRAGREREMG